MPIVKINAQGAADTAAQLITDRATLWAAQDGARTVAAVRITADAVDDDTAGYWSVVRNEYGAIRLKGHYDDAGSAIIDAKAIARDMHVI